MMARRASCLPMGNQRVGGEGAASEGGEKRENAGRRVDVANFIYEVVYKDREWPPVAEIWVPFDKEEETEATLRRLVRAVSE